MPAPDVFTNETGCVLTRSNVTGDILCRWPGEHCDCLMRRIDVSYAPDEDRELADEFDENAIGDAADYLRENGRPATRTWLDERIAEIKRGDDPFNPERDVHNYEVARDRLSEPAGTGPTGAPRGEIDTEIIRSNMRAMTNSDVHRLAEEIRDALEGDSNDAEHDALVSVASALGIDYEPDQDERTFAVRRFYQEGHPSEVIKTGLTLEQARAHCTNPETSSSTATSTAALIRTREMGPWFDGYEEEG